MNLAIVLVIAAVLVLATILSLSVSRGLQNSRESTGTAVAIRPIDIEAFRNLIDPAEDSYLRRRLPPAKYRAVRRERLRAMAVYVHIAGSNAAVLVRVGGAALASGDPQVAGAAQRLVNDALLLRRNSAVAQMRIYLALAWPNSEFAAVRVVDDRYERLSGAAMLLGRLQNPVVPVRLSVSN